MRDQNLIREKKVTINKIKIAQDFPDICFLGSSKYSARILNELMQNNIAFKVVITNPPKRRARGKKAEINDVEKIARNYLVDVFYEPDKLLDYRLSFGLVVAYGKIIKDEILQKVPMLNVHFSLLPAYRGAAPVERAILNGERQTGVTLMQITNELDAGPIYRSEAIEIKDDDTKETLYAKLCSLATQLLLEEFEKGFQRGGPIGIGIPREQQGEVSYAQKIKKEDLHVDFNNTAQYILRQIRLGGAFFYVGDKLVKLDSAELVQKNIFSQGNNLSNLEVSEMALVNKEVYVRCNNDTYLKIVKVTPEGSKSQSAVDFLNGLRVKRLKIKHSLSHAV